MRTAILCISKGDETARAVLAASAEQPWEVIVARSSQEAADVIERRTLHAVVSEQAEGELNAADVLSVVRLRHPSAARIAVGPFADQSAATRVAAIAHRCLTKGGDAHEAAAAVEASIELRRRVGNSGLRQAIARLGPLPTPPETYTRIMRRLEDDASSFDSVAEEIKRDTAITAKLLQIVNAPYFGFARRVDTAREAVKLLGLDAVRSLTLAEGLFAQLDVPDREIAQVSEHGLRVGVLARRLLGRLDAAAGLAGQTFTAGVLHDVGELVLLSAAPQKAREARAVAVRDGIPLHEAEAAVFGADHADVGGALLLLWNLPDPIVEAVAYHHHPDLIADKLPPTLLAVHLADAADRREHPDPGRNGGAAAVMPGAERYLESDG